MKHIQRINRSFGILGFIGLAALFMPATCEGQGYTISTVAGGSAFYGHWGDGGPAVSAYLYLPDGVAADTAGNLYISDQIGLIRRVSPTGIISTVAGNDLSPGQGYSGDGGPATAALLNYPAGIALDSAGNLYIADSYNNRIRKLSPAGIITTVAGGGNPGPTIGDGGPAASATLNHPNAVAVDTAGDLYVADTGNYRVRRVATNGTITTVAGTGAFPPGSASVGDGSLATGVPIEPSGVLVDIAGNIYISDGETNRVRKVSPNGIITTIAGTGAIGMQSSSVGDGGPAISAALDGPQGLAMDGAGNLYIGDSGDLRVRMVAPNGIISTIAGEGFFGDSGDGGAAADAAIESAYAVAVGVGGKVYIADYFARDVRMLTPTASTVPPSISSGGIVTASAFGAFPSVAPGSWIEIYGANLGADSRSWTGADFTGVNAPTSLDGTKVTIGGQSAFIDYISPTQVNAQVPSNVATGSQPVIVTSAAGASSASTITVNQQEPGLLAPSSFSVGGKQYVAALFSDGATFVLPPGAITGVPSRPALPGDTITLYGVGFGPVTPSTPAGQIVQQTNTLTGVLHVLFGQTQAVIGYDGLAPNAVGLYQFNVVVPSIAASDTVPLTFTLGGVAGTQTLYIAVGN